MRKKIVLAGTLIFTYILVTHFSLMYAQLHFEMYSGKAKTTDSKLKVSIPESNSYLKFEQVKFTDKSFEFPLYYGL